MLKRILTTTIAGAVLATGTVFATGTSATAASASTCPSGSWDTRTLGVPTAARAGMNGVAVFRASDNNVFSVVMSTNPARPALYTGSIESDAPISFSVIRVERGDVVRKAAPNKIVFAMTNRGHLDGIRVAAPCSANLKFTLNRGGHRVATSNIGLGSTMAHPSTNPFTITKA